jgi:hypothetical protein
MTESKDREKYNFFSFFSNDDDDTELTCMTLNDDVMGDTITDEGSLVGHKYQIVLVKDHSTDPDKFDHFDFFEAILADPLTYIEQLIGWGWYGVIIKKTTKSKEIIDIAIDNIRKVL